MGDQLIGSSRLAVFELVKNAYDADASSVSNNILVGAIDISLATSGDPARGLIEKTNREGFVENEAYAKFKAIVLGALIEFEHLREADKDRIRAALKTVTEVALRSLGLACLSYLHTAHEAAGATGTRHSPRPLLSEGSWHKASGGSRRENADLCLFGFLKRESANEVLIAAATA